MIIIIMQHAEVGLRGKQHMKFRVLRRVYAELTWFEYSPMHAREDIM